MMDRVLPEMKASNIHMRYALANCQIVGVQVCYRTNGSVNHRW